MAMANFQRLAVGTQEPYGSSAIIDRPALSLITRWMSPSLSILYCFSVEVIDQVCSTSPGVSVALQIDL